MKAVCLVKDHKHVKEVTDKMVALRDNLLERNEFLENQAKKMAEEFDEKRKALWKEMDEALILDNIVPEGYDKKTCNLKIEIDSGVLFWGQKGECNHSDELPAFIKAIIKAMTE